MPSESIIYREATVADIPQIQIVRNSVKENMLSNPALVTDKDNEEYITVRGKGWVCEINNIIVGFANADLKTKSIWALFVKPEHEKKGIGKKLHQLMLDWYFIQSKEKLWLETAANTRAEKFYKSFGWIETERHERKSSSPNSSIWIEIKLELTFDKWTKKQNA